MATQHRCTFYGCEDASGDGGSLLCPQHQNQEWYTVREAAVTWNVSERTVRDWIHPRGIVAAQRRGRRPYLIPLEELTRPHPEQRVRPAEAQPLVVMPMPRGHQWVRRPALLAFVVLILALLAAGVGTAAGTGLGRRSLAGTGLRQPPSTLLAGKSPPAVRFDGWTPLKPKLAYVGDRVALSVYFTNSGDSPREFHAAVTLRKPDGEQVNVRPLRRITLEPGKQGTASWTHLMDQVGPWDVVYGIWEFWEEGKEPEGRIGNTGWFDDYVVVNTHCSKPPDGGVTARIDGYQPFRLVEMLNGDRLTLSMDFTNTGDVVRSFVAGASVLDADKNIKGDYDQDFVNLLPGEQATASWEHRVEEPGSYLVQFGVWAKVHEGLLASAQCPFTRLILAHDPKAPIIAGVDLVAARRSSESQWITVRGKNFTPESRIVLRLGPGEYPIPPELTRYESPNVVRVFESLTAPGTWSAQLVDAKDTRSNLFRFQVLP